MHVFSERLRIKSSGLIISLALFLALASTAWAGEADTFLPPFTPGVNYLLYFVLFSAVAGLLYGVYLAVKANKADQGTPKMIAVAKAIQEGDKAYLTRQMRVLAIFIIFLTALIFLVYKGVYLLPDGSVNWKLLWGISIAFLLGSTLSATTGIVGMSVAVRGNVRVE